MRRIVLWVTLGPVIAACTGEEREDGERPPETTVVEPSPGAPEFVDPPTEPLPLASDEHRDRTFRIQGVDNGTRVLLDRRELTPSVHPPQASLGEDTLTLHFNGAMIPGAHTLLLQGEDPSLVSTYVRFDVFPALSAALRPTLPERFLGRADRLLVGGGRGEEVLGLLVLDPEISTVTLYSGSDESWSTSGVAMAIPSWTPSLSIAIGATRTGTPWVAWTGHDAPQKLWWGTPGREPTALEPFAEVAHPYEYARLGTLFSLGDRWVFEREVFRDVEAPRPGDHTLLEVRLQPEGPGLPRPLASLADDDAFDPRRVVDIGGWRWLEQSAVLVHRTHQPPALLAFPLDGEPRTLPTGPLLPYEVAAMVLGSFESRIMIVRDEASHTWFFAMEDASSGVSPPIHALGIDPEERPHCVATQLQGVPVFLFPGGTDRPTLAVLGDRVDPSPFALPELACDEIVVRASLATDRQGSAALACRQGSEVFLGRVSLRAGPSRI